MSRIPCRYFVLCKVASINADILALVSEFVVVVILSELPTTVGTFLHVCVCVCVCVCV